MAHSMNVELIFAVHKSGVYYALPGSHVPFAPEGCLEPVVCKHPWIQSPSGVRLSSKSPRARGCACLYFRQAQSKAPLCLISGSNRKDSGEIRCLLQPISLNPRPERQRFRILFSNIYKAPYAHTTIQLPHRRTCRLFSHRDSNEALVNHAQTHRRPSWQCGSSSYPRRTCTAKV